MPAVAQPAPPPARVVRDRLAVSRLDVAAYTIPTEEPESDGTLAWTSTTLVVVEATAGAETGIGYTYAHEASALLAATKLREVVEGGDPFAVAAAHRAMTAACRNLGARGLAAMAISAVDAALWDLKARLLGVPLVDLLGPCRDAVPVYGSGGFTSLSVERLEDQLRGWAETGIRAVKMKVGRDPEADVERVVAARRAVGDDVVLMVDANGAYDRAQAIGQAWRFADEGVAWFEEPVSSDDLDGLRRVRDGAPPGMEVTAGEYGWDLAYFARMLDAGAVDVLQPDAGRCGGVTGFLAAATLCRARSLPASSHTAPALHAAPCCAAPAVRHLEYFHDHARIEAMAFDGAPELDGGDLVPRRDAPGNGLALRRADLEPYLVWRGGDA